MKGLLAGILLFLLLPFPAAAQAQTREEVQTGRFGAEEPEIPEAPGETLLPPSRFYLGFRAGPSLRVYTPGNDTPWTGGDSLGFSLDLAFYASLRLLSSLSLQGEAVFTWDKASLWAYRAGSVIDLYTKDYRTFSLEFPLLVRWDHHPGPFRLSLLGGAYFILPLGKLRAGDSLGGGPESLSWAPSLPIGLTGGLSGAVPRGPGRLVADLRVSGDLGNFEASGGGIEAFRRSRITLSLGYEWGEKR
jgi:hypothetical protein